MEQQSSLRSTEAFEQFVIPALRRGYLAEASTSIDAVDPSMPAQRYCQTDRDSRAQRGNDGVGGLCNGLLYAGIRSVSCAPSAEVRSSGQGRGPRVARGLGNRVGYLPRNEPLNYCSQYSGSCAHFDPGADARWDPPRAPVAARPAAAKPSRAIGPGTTAPAR